MTALFSLSDDQTDNTSVDLAPAPVEAVVSPVITPEKTAPAPTPEPVEAPDTTASPYLFRLRFEDEPLRVLAKLKKSDPRRHKRIQTVLRKLEEVGPTYPSLRTRKWSQPAQPGVPDTYQSNVENNAPSAWRIYWHFGQGENLLVINEIGPHASNHSTY